MDTNDVNLGMLVLRVLFGGTLALHGLNKFRNGLGGVGSWFESIGLKPGKFHATMAASTELFGGLALLAGLLLPFSALAVVGTMAVAGWVEHRKAFFIFKEGFEFTMVIAAAAVVIATVGPGEWSIDNALGLDLNGVPGLLISALGGIAAAIAHLATFYRPPAKTAA